ncbi:MAG: AAA family ATPase [Chlamydiales bacterium]|nr:ATP-binding protein [Chlamydiales bacterium]NCF71415.1 AAA family ATPase [Chlamydiales bacterium]
MKRKHTSFLINWLNSTSRRPLVIRGARQVGKTWLVRDFAQLQKLNLVELNFEKQPELISLFTSNNPKEILLNLRASMSREIDPSKSLLFLDEIQAAPQLLEKLRWFAEDMPELPLIVAGSLLDFALAKHKFSMPVGRIGYMYLEPLSFEEFLSATGEQSLKEYLECYDWHTSIPEAIHLQLMKAVKEYLLVGGMPAAVKAWAETQAPEQIAQIQLDLLSTYREDFSKYSGKLDTGRIEDVISAVPRQLGEKFVYKKVNSDIASAPLKQALSLLSKARICHQILASAANGLPLGAETNEKFKKVIMLDCGLCGISLGLSLHQLSSISELIMINNGGMAEQFVGQQLRTLSPPYENPSVFYWQRTAKEASAEIDYVIQHKDQIIPLEVKAGKTGTLKSLHQFMELKGRKIAVRINSDYPSCTQAKIKTASSSYIKYSFLSLPFYLLGQLHRLIDSAQK